MAPSDIPNTAVTTHFGQFEFVKMPFGLCNTARTFQLFTDQILRGVPSAYTYIDGVLIASPTPEQHLDDLRNVFARLASHGIVIKPNKCLFGVITLIVIALPLSLRRFRQSVTFHNPSPSASYVDLSA